MITIYGMIDPRTDRLRYVGQTSQNLQTRLTGHKTCVRSGRKRPGIADWMEELDAAGIEADIFELESFADPTAADEAECFWISYFRGIGCDLANRIPRSVAASATM